MYDLVQMLKSANMDVPPELARNEASKNKPGSVEERKKKPTIQFAKK